MYRRQYLLLTFLAIFGSSLWLAPGRAQAAEARCNELGANCVCSEPFNTNQFTRNSYWFNPSDSTNKECATDGNFPGGAIEANPINHVVFRNDSSALAALPPGHHVQYFGGGIEGHNNVFFAGNTMASAFTKRAAARYYVYHSPNYQFKDEGVCENSKMLSLGILGIDKSFGNPHAYNFTSFSCSNPSGCPLPRDCCWIGPGPTTLQRGDWKGKWWRVEIVVVNRAGPGFDMKVYMKNVTDNTPEVRVLDLSVPCPDCGSGTGWVPNSSIVPPSRLDRLVINQYRQGTCAGWSGFSHYMVAGWDTDQGQRIGSAFEVEGGSGSFPAQSSSAAGSSSSTGVASSSGSSTSPPPGGGDPNPPGAPSGLTASVSDGSSSGGSQ